MLYSILYQTKKESGKTIKTIEDIEDFNFNFLSLKINKEKIIEVLENFGGVKL